MTEVVDINNQEAKNDPKAGKAVEKEFSNIEEKNTLGEEVREKSWVRINVPNVEFVKGRMLLGGKSTRENKTNGCMSGKRDL